MKHLDEDFISDSKAALLTRTTPIANAILLTIIGFVLIGLIWAKFALLDETTTGEGKVIPSSQVKVIQSLDGGIITEIPVHEGDIVKKGQILVLLDNTRYKADYQQVQAKYFALSALVSRLIAETQKNAHIDFPAELKQGHDDLIVREEKLFQTRKDNLAKELSMLNQSYGNASAELKIHSEAVKKGVEPKIEYLKALRLENDLKRNILETESKFYEGALTELNQNKADLATVTEQLITLKDKMVHTTITSPIHGVVKKIYFVTVGGVIQPGVSIMDIVPLEDTLLVQARIHPSDIAFVHIGQPASVKITAYDYSIYGSLPGKVEYISADAIDDPKSQQYSDKNAASYYLVNIRTQTNHLGNDTRKLTIMPGMNASVQVMTGKKTVLQYLLKPLMKAKEEALRER